MVNLSFQANYELGPVSHQRALGDLDAYSASGTTILYGTNGSAGGVISYVVNQATGALTLADSDLLPPLAAVDGPAHLESMRLGGQDFLVNLGRHADGLNAIQIQPNGSLDTNLDMSGTDGEGISTLVYHEASTRNMLYVGYWGRSDLGIYEVTSGGALSYIGQIASPFETDGADLLDLRVTQVSGQDVLVYASRYQDKIVSYTINSNGGLAVADVLRMSDGLPVDTPSAVEIATLGAQRFAVLASSGTSTLTVMEITSTGRLEPSDHINANTATRIENLVALDTIEVGGRAFVVAGGANDGVSLFELFPDGRLHHWDALPDLVGGALANVTSVSALERAGGIDIYVSSETENGVTQLRVDLPAAGVRLTGDAGDNTLSGGAQADVLYGADGDDTLTGLAGDDVLIGGTGQNQYTGGTGSDLFVVSLGATHDHILDFELGVDRLDLSGLGRLYDISGLGWTARAGGADITFGSRVIEIDTHDGSTLQASDFTSAELFNLTHTDLTYMDGRTDPAGDITPSGNFEGSAGSDDLRGTALEDTIIGNLGDDTLYGGDGNDILNGGEGADIHDGGNGSDWVSYEGSRGSLRVDLMFAQINTNVASGDSYISIENLIGSQGFDNLRGTLEDNHIVGGRNVDFLFGRRGDDTLEGGIGDDVLFGGVGADVLIGGANRDRAQYSEALTSVTVDLATPANNTGEAAGDTFDSIEDLAGGRFDDSLYGDRDVNRLFGREGSDALFGRDGNDYLNGGANNDTLDGGAGDDVLRGGQSFDTFVFREGLDLIEDYNTAQDSLLFDSSLLAGGPVTASRAMDFASVVGSNVVFDFGASDQLTLQNVTTLVGLEDDIGFV